MITSIPGTTVKVHDESGGLAIEATFSGGTPPATVGVFAPGCRLTNLATGVEYKNTGTTASPVWDSEDAISTSEITDGAITAAKLVGSQSVTSTADGLTTGLITAPTSAITFVAVTSAAATNQVSLPAITAASIGQVIYLTVGANGYELITPASSNNTINTVDADGTNQLDVAATTTVRATQISATAWICETIAATSIAITAPDND